MAESEGVATPAVVTPTQAVSPANQPQAGETSTTQAAEEIISLEEARKLRREAQTLRSKLTKFEEAETERQNAQLSEVDKLKKQLAETVQAKTALERAALQRQAAEKIGLPSVFADRLKGETLEELEADAKAIQAALPKAAAPNVGATNPGSNATGDGETTAQRLARINGQSVNVFNPADISKLGGGVIFNEK
jgi:exonuclease VII large subunit